MFASQNAIESIKFAKNLSLHKKTQKNIHFDGKQRQNNFSVASNSSIWLCSTKKLGKAKQFSMGSAKAETKGYSHILLIYNLCFRLSFVWPKALNFLRVTTNNVQSKPIFVKNAKVSEHFAGVCDRFLVDF